VPFDAKGEDTGTLLTLLNPYALLAGLASLAIFALHGAVDLSLKTKAERLVRSRTAARWRSAAAALLAFALLLWTCLNAVSADEKGIVPGVFLNLFPRALVSSTNPDHSLTTWSTSSTHYTLVVMTIVALLLTPVVLVYQGCAYYVFRHRGGRDDLAPLKSPIELLSGARLPGPVPGA